MENQCPFSYLWYFPALMPLQAGKPYYFTWNAVVELGGFLVLTQQQGLDLEQYFIGAEIGLKRPPPPGE